MDHVTRPCPYCGKSVDVAAYDTMGVPEIDYDYTAKCEHCGHESRIHVEFSLEFHEDLTDWARVMEASHSYTRDRKIVIRLNERGVELTDDLVEEHPEFLIARDEDIGYQVAILPYTKAQWTRILKAAKGAR